SMGRNLDKRRFDPSATVPGFDITIQEMWRALHDLYARIGGPNRRAGLRTDPLRPWRGVRYWVFALAVGRRGIYVGWVARGLALDGRAPVTYLRPFRDDEAMVGRPIRFSFDVFRWSYILTEYTRGGMLRVMSQHGQVRLEQAIEDEVSAIGPFIAIGEPHESHPDFGATRAYFEGDDEAWRTAVQSWIARAALVVVVPGQTKGLGWELGKIQAGGITPKLLLVFPPERSTSRATRLAALGGMLTDPRWLDAITTSQRSDLLAMFPTSQGDL